MTSDDNRPGEHLPRPVSSLPGWAELASPAGSELLAAAAALRADGSAFDRVSAKLRRQSDDTDLIAAALTVTGLRERAGAKFGPLAPELLLTQAGLEQASRFVVANLHAARFSGCDTVADLGCGLGAESLALLRAGIGVRAVELDPLTAAFAKHNLGVAARALAESRGSAPSVDVIVGDATVVGPGEAEGVFLDPARRTAGHRDTRRVHADDYSPSLDFAFASARAAHTGGVKLGPGLDRELIPVDAEAQWVSVDGQLVEMGLWFGAGARPGVRRAATVLRGGGSPEHTPAVHELLAADDAPDADVRGIGEYLLEPDGAVIRARLIGLLAAELDAGMLHEGIAYLSTDREPTTPFAQVFRVVEELPTREKELKRALAQRGIGRLEIKKRGVDVDPAALRTRLRLKGPESATLVLSRSAGRHVALLAERC